MNLVDKLHEVLEKASALRYVAENVEGLEEWERDALRDLAVLRDAEAVRIEDKIARGEL